MPNVIDALKRLERIGSEHSETTKKIVAAAEELSAKIASFYPAVHEAGFNIVDNRANEDSDPFEFKTILVDPDGKPDPKCTAMRYDLQRDSSGQLHLYNVLTSSFVHEDRAAALQFAADIATGLLGYIERNLERLLAEDRERLPLIESALLAVSGRKTPDGR